MYIHATQSCKILLWLQKIDNTLVFDFSSTENITLWSIVANIKYEILVNSV